MKMRTEHFDTDAETVPYDTLEPLVPPESLASESVARGAAGAALLRGADPDRVVVAAPVSTATGYHLASMPLTVVRVDALDDPVREHLASAAGLDLGTTRLVVFGRNRQRDHALEEFA